MSRERDFSPGAPWNVTRGQYREQYPSPPPAERPLGWGHQPVFQDSTRVGAPAVEFRPFDDRVAERHFNMPSHPMDPYSARRVIVFNRDISREMYPRLPPFQRQLLPRHLGQRDRRVHIQTGETNLTKEEQEMALRKLKKQIYYPPPKIKGKETKLYYRELSRDPNVKAKDKYRDEEGKTCAICLEDFEPREEVLLTPCNHMFHEECVVPWVKDQGKCPVCRSALFERIRENRPPSHDRGPVIHSERGLFFDELLSLIHAMDEAFIRGF